MPNDTESPDHAGLRSDARVSEDDAIALLDKLEGETRNGHCVADIDDVLDALLGAHAKGHTAGCTSQSAELATLRGEVEQLKVCLKIDGEVLTAEIDKNRDAIFDIDRLQKDAVEKDREIAQMAAEMLKLRADLASSIASNAKWVQRELGKNARRDDPFEAK